MVASTQSVPSKTCKFPTAAAPKSTPKPSAPLSAKARLKLTSWTLRLESSTVKTAKSSVPSTAATSLTETAGMSAASIIDVVTSSSSGSIPMASKPPPATLSMVTTINSSPSNNASSTVGKVNATESEPAGITTVATLVKSEPSVAVPL